MGRCIALVDCNNFFVSCERLVTPSLKGKPVVVLSNNDGCIISRSNEAKALGIPMGAPYHLHKHQLKQHGVHVFSSNYKLYKLVSDKIMRILADTTPHIEFYSIDEAFLDLTGMPDLAAYAQHIQRVLGQETGIPVSIGLAPSKTLAKIANYYAKRAAKTGGILDLSPAHYREVALKRLPVQEVWGIGSRLAQKLNRLGIHTAWDLSEAEDAQLLKRFGVVMLRTVHELRGVSCLQLTEVAEANKMIMTSLSFGCPLETLTELYEPLANYVAHAAAKMRRQKSAARALCVFLQTSRHSRQEPYWKNSQELQLTQHTVCTQELTQAALSVLNRIYEPGRRYHKMGVILYDLQPAESIQQSLFDTQDRQRQERLMTTLDWVNAQYGPGALRYAVEGTQKRWRNRRAFLSDATEVIQRFASSEERIVPVCGMTTSDLLMTAME